MSGKPSAEVAKARAAFVKSSGKLTAKQLAKRFGLHLSTIYRSKWFIRPTKP